MKNPHKCKQNRPSKNSSFLDMNDSSLTEDLWLKNFVTFWKVFTWEGLESMLNYFLFYSKQTNLKQKQISNTSSFLSNTFFRKNKTGTHPIKSFCLQCYVFIFIYSVKKAQSFHKYPPQLSGTLTNWMEHCTCCYLIHTHVIPKPAW